MDELRANARVTRCLHRIQIPYFLISTFSQNPQTFSELPERIWNKVIKYLSPADINSMHLVSQRFHELANLYSTNGKLLVTLKLLESKSHVQILKRSSRIFNAMQFGQRFERLKNSSHDSTLKFMAQKFGPQVKQFRIDFYGISKNMVLEMLEQMPKLEMLDIHGYFSYEEVKEKIGYLVELPNLETIKIFDNDSGNPSKILNFLETPNIKRVKFSHYGIEEVESYLERYKTNIKHLSLTSFEENQLDVLPKLKNMRLEHLNMYVGNWEYGAWGLLDENYLLPFLKLQALGLKSLCFQRVCVTNEYLRTAIESMPNLETLILKDSDYWTISESVTNDLHKLTKLKKLVIDLADNYKGSEFKRVKTNYLKGLRVSSNENLEELESFFPRLD